MTAILPKYLEIFPLEEVLDHAKCENFQEFSQNYCTLEKFHSSRP